MASRRSNTMSIPPASLFHSLSAFFVEQTDTLNQTGYTTGAEIVVLTKVVNGKHYEMQQMILACNLRYYELWRLLQLYAVVVWRCPKQPHLWESLSQESNKPRFIKRQLFQHRGASFLCHITCSNTSYCSCMKQHN